MPAQSRRNRSRQPAARKTQSRQQNVGAVPAPTSATPVASDPPKAVAASQPIRNPYISAELKMSGILAVLMLVVLVLLKLVLD